MFIVVEIQVNADGTAGALVTSFADQNAAESAYHTILAAAAVSSLPKHGAIMFSDEGFPLMHACYKHAHPDEE